jgi:hypothetical protein
MEVQPSLSAAEETSVRAAKAARVSCLSIEGRD